jgi:hypothetical protein
VTRRLVAADAGAWVSGAEDNALLRRWVAAGLPLAPPAAVELRGAGIGSLAPLLVIVGEAPRREGQHPLHARTGGWLWPALRALGWDELACRAANAFTHDDRPDPALDVLAERVARGVPWLALGKRAASRCRALGRPPIEAAHPAHARRFRYAAGPEGYAAQLAARGLPRGPATLPLALPFWPGALPLVPAPLADVPASTAYRPDPARRAARLAPAPVGPLPPLPPPLPTAPHPSPPPAVAPPAPATLPPGQVLRALGEVALQVAVQDVVERLRAGRGVPSSVEALRRLRAAGDEAATPLHLSVPDLRKLLEVAAALAYQSGGAAVDAGPSVQDLAAETEALLAAERRRAASGEVA